MLDLALSFLYSPTLTSIHDYWKNHRQTFVSKVMSLLFNTLSSLSQLYPYSLCITNLTPFFFGLIHKLTQLVVFFLLISVSLATPCSLQGACRGLVP